MKHIRNLLPVAIVLAMAGMANAADAPQQAPQAQASAAGHMMNHDGLMGGRHMGPGMMDGEGPDGMMCMMMGRHIEGRLAFLKTELKITANQEALWNAYADAARANAKEVAGHCTTMMNKANGSATSLPDRLDQHEQLMAAHLEALRAMNKALKPLYAALTEQQKKDIDEIAWGPIGMM